ncbi:hypothetical protein BDP27DRAFT_1364045 [Rhodocollybia butyracea]|uniref:Uncharacterized protein n=1 Tax=Rhodocollybia butyracea TaxID=206335 RepID=A0A9P5PR13_9AGAR|nr:hypothetical protein BDP27DRAFT_1364045 [Rhodocollybia butyracea]
MPLPEYNRTYDYGRHDNPYTQGFQARFPAPTSEQFHAGVEYHRVVNDIRFGRGRNLRNNADRNGETPYPHSTGGARTEMEAVFGNSAPFSAGGSGHTPAQRAGVLERRVRYAYPGPPIGAPPAGHPQMQRPGVYTGLVIIDDAKLARGDGKAVYMSAATVSRREQLNLGPIKYKNGSVPATLVEIVPQ